MRYLDCFGLGGLYEVWLTGVPGHGARLQTTQPYLYRCVPLSEEASTSIESRDQDYSNSTHNFKL